MEKRESKYVELKDLVFDPMALVAVGKVLIPATMQTPEFYAISVYLADVKEPIGITYATAEERDAEFETIRHAIL